MPTFHAWSTAEVPARPWRGAAGSSLELARWPTGPTGMGGPATGDPGFDLRLSIETFEAPGRLPTLRGFEYWLLCLTGEGLRLRAEPDRTLRARRGETLRLPGEWEIEALGVEAPVSLFSVCARTGRARASVQLLRLRERELRESLTSRLALLFVTAGQVVVRATAQEEPFELEAGDALRVDGGSDGDELALAGRALDTELVLAWLDVG